MIQPLSYIHPNAKIAETVTIDPFTTIYGDVEIGEGTWIGSHVTIMDGARIGKNCKIFPGAVISGIPQDLKYKNEKTTAEIGDNCVIRECVTINRGTTYANTTKVGNNCLIMAYVHLGHDTIVGDNVIIANSCNLGGHVIVEDWAILGGNINVQQFTRIGAHSYISGGISINKDIPPYVKAARMPASYHGVNSVGLKRRGFSQETINHIFDVYRILFVRNSNITKGIEMIEADITPTAERDLIVNFVNASKIGVLKGFRKNGTN
ncbi:MAG: acyl-ACP--UDP-N-acetylglucosamine O-acyltransferase [Chitinophagales bacterium]|jgi:UDP-N-acetylglucosamine acyltransferase|nr:acyl-ACP--UDP-N-acetylglucosamine O-acyltransferase [Sphingobacteriales bacterium]